ncbi:acetyl-CoA carboxylase biotin carboxyl carrier protein [Bacillus taeanensis]|uniref:Biotin carboxyl carrier protein of acetyl-CoA carboxylase n=1 Tax=Bacillus taeanensis TaxID=273032 RepID=A0A366XYA4_9BACI|nr:acetyl-CoA carboxylase biotin carboxyl carrier protein [Bacillus taeanensis]RBW70606.1 acetyl-CoA carboxylase biotin carboxyl carrier protein [Bacillus taeanensis]
MLKIQEIRELIKLIDKSSIDEFTYEHEGNVISLKKNNAAVQPQQVVEAPVQVSAQKPEIVTEEKAPQQVSEQAAPKSEENYKKIVSPMVGTFYASPSPEDPLYVQPGDKVKENTVVCIVEAMKLFNEIEAEVKGEIVEVLVDNGQLVEYGQPLFLVKPE